jgi:hypothetical protein
MPTRPQLALLLSCVLSCAAIAVAAKLFAERACANPSTCDDGAIAWVVGLPIGLLGLALLAVAALSWTRNTGRVASALSIVWACVLLGAGCAIGGAANVFGILLAMLAVVMGAVSVWATG